MNSILTAMFWLAIYAATLALLLLGLSRRSRRIVDAYESLRRRAPANGVSLLADLHVRRALWFALLDQMHERYTLLLQSARASHRGKTTL
jgi:hypothetical protein